MAYMSSCRDAGQVIGVLSANVIFTCDDTCLNVVVLLKQLLLKNRLLLKHCWHGRCLPLADHCLDSAMRLSC